MNINSFLSPLTIEGVMTAFLCGFIIGTEREISAKPTGMRTNIFICLGTYIFVASGHLLHAPAMDPSRIIGQVITGIGFIGAGAILTQGGVLIGVTSASVIWVLAGIGVLIGLERYVVSIVLSFFTVAILIALNFFEKKVISPRKKDPDSK